MKVKYEGLPSKTESSCYSDASEHRDKSRDDRPGDVWVSLGCRRGSTVFDGHRFAYFRRNLCPEDLNRFHKGFVRRTTHVHVGGESRETKHFMHAEDLVDGLVRIADNIGTLWSTTEIELLPAEWRPAPRTAYARHLRRVNREVFISGLFAILAEEAVHVYADFELLHVVSEVLP